MNQPTSEHIQAVLEVSKPLLRFMRGSLFTENANKPGMSNFAVGNPHEMPLAGFADGDRDREEDA
jgi:hypothetical protein